MIHRFALAAASAGSLFGVLVVIHLAPGPARAADTALSVLGVEASEGAPEAAAVSLTEALRQRVSSTKGFRLVPGRDLVEVKLIFSCPDEAPSCMAEAAKNLGATKIIFGSIKKSVSDSYLVTLKILDANKRAVEAYVAEQLPRAQASPSTIKTPVQKWFATLTGQSAGAIRVAADVVGASISVDGVPMGVTGTDPVVLTGIAAGPHDLRITKPGLEPVKRDVNVPAGETIDVSVQLGGGDAAAPAAPLATAEPAPVETGEVSGGLGVTVAPGRPSGGNKTAIKAASWGVLGAGLLGIGLGIKFGLDVQAINKDLDPFRRFECDDSPWGCRLDGKPLGGPRTAEQEAYVQNRRDQGKKFQRLQYVAYGAGSALVLASGYLFYKAYLTEEEDGPRASAARPTLVPFVTATEGGLAALLRF